MSEEVNLDFSLDQESSDDSCDYVDPLHAVKSPVKDCEKIEAVDSVFENPDSPAFGNIDSPDSPYLPRPSSSRDTFSWSSNNQFFTVLRTLRIFRRFLSKKKPWIQPLLRGWIMLPVQLLKWR